MSAIDEHADVSNRRRRFEVWLDKGIPGHGPSTEIVITAQRGEVIPRAVSSSVSGGVDRWSHRRVEICQQTEDE